ncbi:MAG: D-alanine--D-alanine ligase [Candidatus Marinimicrobia bacterium]|nr:D-alanine--D-alanine ligase [Candidatus Neomarinimicrobiota bacterium]|tara:strand:- start:1560 stop:2498 length:939 start_codon:yes stop_codon:yes gene_type:complete
MNLAVVSGGTSSEREVSINTGKSVVIALKDSPNVFSFDFKGDYDLLLSQLKSNDIDLVFNALHGGDGEDGTFQFFLERNSICYTGSDSKSSKIAMDKHLTKKICLDCNIPTAKWKYFKSADMRKINFTDLANQFSRGCVIKPAREGSSVGMHILNTNIGNLNQLNIQNVFNAVFEISNDVIIEDYIKGRELTVGILGLEALPVVEVFPKNFFYDYSSKYQKGECEYEVPADLNKDYECNIKEYALKLHKMIGCHAYSRVDFLMDEQCNIFTLEINTLPGLTDTSLLPKATASIDMSYYDTINKIIDFSFNKN